MAKNSANQVYRDLLGVNGLNPFKIHNHGNREQMFSSHIGQCLPIAGCTERYIQTGVEQEYAKYTFSKKMPANAEILKIIQLYPETLGKDSISENPETYVIFENIETREIDLITLSRYFSSHSYLGFDYKNKEALKKLRVGNVVEKGTVLQDSPSVAANGGYMYGIQLNIVYMSLPGVSEDGIIVCEDILPKLAFKKYETRVVEFGSKRFPLNIHGDAENYKPFPEIGEYVREDGLLMSLREYDESLSVVERSVYDVMEPDYTFDRNTYTDPGGRIIDIRVHHDPFSITPTTPEEMTQQAHKYNNARMRFWRDFYDEYKRLKKTRGENLNLSKRFHNMVIKAQSILNNNESLRIQKLYRQAPLDDWRIEFTIEYNAVPGIGGKATDCHGGKGVICAIWKREDMPVDADGNSADVIMDGGSTNSRMNTGRKFEQFINAASRDVVKHLKKQFSDGLAIPDGYIAEDLLTEKYLLELEAKSPEKFNNAWNYLLGYYELVSNQMYQWLVTGAYPGSRAGHMAYLIKSGMIHIFWPTENQAETDVVIDKINQLYRPTYGPVRYRGFKNDWVTTKRNVRIGSVYFILLEKIGDDWMAVSSGKVQHHRVLSQLTNADKYTNPTRLQAIRAWGEAEIRIGTAYAGSEIMAEILDRNNNPRAHKEVLYSILEASKPTDIDRAIDRLKIPMGGSAPDQLIKHILECGGIRFAYKPYETNWGKDRSSQLLFDVDSE